MRDIILKSDTPLSVTIAADPRLSSTDYVNDQIWELTLNSGEPQALALQTTYGLRATKMRLFPRFSVGHDASTNPSKFAKAPIIQRIFPNFIGISFSPFSSIEVKGEYWVPNSHAVAGRVRISNTSSQNQQIKFELVALLNPSEDGSRIIPNQIDGVTVLSGSTEDLEPVVFITGGSSAISSPYPALTHSLDLPPGNSRQFIWCQAALNTHSDSFSLTREITSCNWEAEIARIELQNSSQLEVYTGNEEWDQTFLLAQKNAYGLLLGKTSNLEKTSYVTTRVPDDGYSIRGDGSDYGSQWSGQTPIDSYYLSNLILPAAPALMADILNNHLESFNENGELDWKPGQGGQRSNRLATPLLANIAWKIYQVSENKDFLRELYPRLLDFFFSWFSDQHDRDEDGIPEWDHPLQAGFEEHPIFARWHSWAQGVDITTAESPSLCAFLYHECQAIIRIAKLLNNNDHIDALESKAENLRIAIEDAWDEQISGYTYWDRDSHKSTSRVILGQLTGSGSIEFNQSFSEPQRIIFQIITSHETTRKIQLIIQGHNPSGKHRIEMIPPEGLLWFPGWGTATSSQTYQSIDSVEIKGLDETDTVIVSNAGLLNQDITTLLPIWSRIPSNERARAMVENNITNPDQFWWNFGFPACPDNDLYSENNPCQNVHLPWCLFIGEGLLSYGYRNETAELVSRIMNAIIQTIKHDGCFRQYYNAETGEGFGDIDALWGLAPLGLFLETLGIRIISPWKIHLSGINPFPWPVTVKFRGMTVLRGHEKTQVVFPDGQTILINEPEPCLVSLE
ncbi:MAG TPA: hypothetical protein VMW34_17315 [Anaerolineales bacterium]|nr:hypothetical protein [Anaerolineales bacterium]